jgi:hypothetical protein
MTRIATIPVLAFALAMSAATAAMASDIAVILAIDAEADATLFSMAGNKIVWKSGDLGDLIANVPHPVPSEVDGVQIESICVRLGEGWRVPNKNGKTFQVSCFGVDQAMIDKGRIGYEMAVEQGEPSVPMPPGM